MIMHLESVVYVFILVAILTVLFKMICSIYLIVSAASYDIIIYTINIACNHQLPIGLFNQLRGHSFDLGITLDLRLADVNMQSVPRALLYYYFL